MKRLAYVVITVVLCSAGLVAQAEQTGQKPAAPAPAVQRPPAAPAEPINVRYQIVIRDVGGAQPATKTVTVTQAVGEQSSIRAQGTLAGRGNHPLNVDVWPMNHRDNRVRTRLGIEYTPLPPDGTQGPAPFFVRETLNVWLESGKPMVVSEATDPISDRRVTVEVTATILR